MISRSVCQDDCHGFSADLGRAVACREDDNYKSNVRYPTNEFFRRGIPGDYVAHQNVPLARTSRRSSTCTEVQLITSVTVSFSRTRSASAGRASGRGAFRTGVSVFVVCECGASSCVHHHRARNCPPQKSSDQLVTRPTKWSDRSSPTSLRRSGRSTPRRASLQKSTRCGIRATHAPFERSSATWRAPVNGPAKPWRSSSPKSCVAIACATSGS